MRDDLKGKDCAANDKSNVVSFSDAVEKRDKDKSLTVRERVIAHAMKLQWH